MAINPRTKFAGVLCLSLCFGASLRSDPLDSWTIREVETGPGASFSSIAFGNGLFVATASVGAEGGWLGYSLDGVHWNSAQCGGLPCSPTQLLGVTFANDRFVAVGDYGWTYVSTNGTDWRLNVVPPSDSTLWAICSGESSLVAVGGMDSCPCGFVAVSVDGQNWIPNYISEILSLRGVASGNGTFVAVGMSDFAAAATRFDIFSTTNPIGSWTAHAVATTNDLFGVTYGKSLFVAVGEEHFSKEACVLTSADGKSWARRIVPGTNALRSVNYLQGLFIATGKAGALLTSTNGLDWVARPSGTRNSLGRSVYAGGAVWIADAGGTLLASDPLLSLRIAAGQQPELTVFGLEGRACRIEATSDLRTPVWSEAGNFILYSSPTIWRDGTPSGGRSRFYRALLLPIGNVDHTE